MPRNDDIYRTPSSAHPLRCCWECGFGLDDRESTPCGARPAHIRLLLSTRETVPLRSDPALLGNVLIVMVRQPQPCLLKTFPVTLPIPLISYNSKHYRQSQPNKFDENYIKQFVIKFFGDFNNNRKRFQSFGKRRINKIYKIPDGENRPGFISKTLFQILVSEQIADEHYHREDYQVPEVCKPRGRRCRRTP